MPYHKFLPWAADGGGRTHLTAVLRVLVLPSLSISEKLLLLTATIGPLAAQGEDLEPSLYRANP